MGKKIKEEYEIVDKIGSGGMATVYKAIQRSLDRPVALKQLKKAFQTDGTIVQRFEREARLGASFQHENIVHIYHYGKAPDFCIVMEHVDGLTLSQILDTAGPLPANVGVMIALQVANALEYAHTRDLIHRDIKSGNIMVKRNGEVKLMDFGIAWTKGLEGLTQPGYLIGTPSYMSPEQALGEELDARSDIFSLGIVLYEMFTGKKPFQEEETVSITAKIVRGRFLSPRKINRDLPRGIQRIIRKCLKRKTHKRYGSAQDLAKALGRRIRGTDRASSLKCISDYLVAKKLVEPPLPDETVVLSLHLGMNRFTKILLSIGAAVLLCVGGIGFYSWTQEENSLFFLPSRVLSAVGKAGMRGASPVSAPTNTNPSPRPTTQVR